jgi:transcription elongation GreA/GreB family factor
MDYHNNVVAGYRARRARIGQIHHLLANAIVGEDPPDDGVAEPGMVLTVRYDDTGDTETFLVGVRGVEDADIEVYSAQSPLGSAIVGARPGEQRTYSIPNNDSVPVTLLDAVPHGLYGHKRLRPRPVSPRGSGYRRPTATLTGRHLPSRRAPATPRRSVATTSPGDVRPVPLLDERRGESLDFARTVDADADARYRERYG